jgi:MFS family permease
MKKKFYPILVLSLCACYLFYKYVLQIYPSVITTELSQTFQLTGTGLGYLTASYYYTYFVTQIFSGALIDKYGARWLSAGAIAAAAIGIVIFSMTENVYIAGLFRGLMGFGVAFATVAYMRLAAGWFPPRQYALVGGLLATAAMAGAVFGQAPLAYIIGFLGWRLCLFAVGMLGLLLAFLFMLLVRDAPPSTFSNVSQHEHFELKHILQVVNNKRNWLLTLYSGLSFSPITIFGGLWGNPFLESAYHLSHAQIASLVSLVFVGVGIGSPLIGLLSDYVGERRNVMILNTLLGGIAISLILYCHPMPIWLLTLLLFFFGFTLGSFMLVFTIGKELNPHFLTGTVIAMINTSEPILNGITEPAIGKLLDLTWDGTIQNGVHIFALKHYQIALSILPIYLFVAALLLFGVRVSKPAK